MLGIIKERMDPCGNAVVKRIRICNGPHQLCTKRMSDVMSESGLWALLTSTAELLGALGLFCLVCLSELLT